MISLDAIDGLLARTLPVGSLFSVGGRVRDELRAEVDGVQPALKDADYVVVGVSLDEIRAALLPYGRVDHVGASFPVLKFTLDGFTVDIALPRREVSTGSGHRDFVIETDDVSLNDDLGRRDFRMNMIARSIPGNEIFDPYNGYADIVARRIDIVSERTFIEDPLRMLRAVQFSARFGYALSERTRLAMCDASALITTVSPQRIGDELEKLLSLAVRPSRGIECMRETGLLALVWPELLEGEHVEQNEWHAFDVYRHNLETLDATPPGDLILRLAALLHDVGKPRVKDGPHFYRHEQVGAEMVVAMLERVAFPASVVTETAHLVRHHMYATDEIMTDAAIRRFIRRIKPASLERLFFLRAGDICGSGLPKRSDANEVFQERVYRLLAEQPAVRVTDLAVDGNDVLDAFRRDDPGEAKPGRHVGEILNTLLEAVTERPELNAREALLGYLAEEVQRQRGNKG